MDLWDKLSTLVAVILVAGLAFTVTTCVHESAVTEAEAQTPNGSEVVGVASVVDGDTIEIHGGRIRLDGFDTPERGKRCGEVNVYQRASNELDGLIGGRTVHCVVTDFDRRNNRDVAQCSVGGQEVGEWMVQQGWARDWAWYSDGAYVAEEAAARAARRGLWGMACPTDLWPANRNYTRRRN